MPRSSTFWILADHCDHAASRSAGSPLEAVASPTTRAAFSFGSGLCSLSRAMPVFYHELTAGRMLA